MTDLENQYGKLIDDDLSLNGARLNQSLTKGLSMSPESAVRIKNLSSQSGIPSRAVIGNEEQVEKKISREKFDSLNLLSNNPVTADYFSNPQSVAISQKDLDNMIKLENLYSDYDKGRLRSSGATFSRSGARSFIDFHKSYSADEAQAHKHNLQVFDEIDAGKIIPFYKRIGKSVRDYIEADQDQRKDIRSRSELRSDPRNLKHWKQGEEAQNSINAFFKTNPRYKHEFLAGKVSDGFGSLVSSVSIGLLTKGLGTAASGMAIAGHASNVAATSGFEEAINTEGTSLEQALEASQLSRFGGYTEALPIVRMFDRIDDKSGGTIKNAIISSLKAGTEEALQETVQTIWQNVIASDLVKYDTGRGVFEGTGDGASVGFTVGSVTQGVLSLLLGRRARQVNGIDNSEQTQLDEIHSISSSSETAKLDPEGYSQQLKNIQERYGKDENVYIPAEDVSELLQASGISMEGELNPALQAIKDQIEEASLLGGDIVIPISDYAAHLASGDSATDFREIVRLSADTLSNIESERFGSEDAGNVQRMVERANTNVEFKLESDKILADITQKLVDTGQLAPRTAKVNSMLLSSYVVTKAVNEGRSVKEVYDSMGLQIEGELKSFDALEEAAFQPERVKSAPNGDDFRPNDSTIFYQSKLSSNRFKAYEKENTFKRWDKAITQLKNQKKDTFKVVAPAPLILRELGIAKNISLTKRRHDKILEKHGHELPETILDDIPRLLSESEVIYRRDKDAPDETVLLQVVSNIGEPIVIGFRGGELRTVTPRNNDELRSGSEKIAEDLSKYKILYARSKEALAKAKAINTLSKTIKNNGQGTIPNKSTAASKSSHSQAGQRAGSKNIVFYDDLVKKYGNELYQLPSNNAKQGGISFSGEGAIIQLMSASNLSTFAHEAGHLFLQMELEGEITADKQKILGFLGVKSVDEVISKPGEGISPKQREAHEKWARAWELYLFEGKSPSPELRTVFARFTSWMKQIYKSLQRFSEEFGVELNDDIRGVMDRLLATDEQIRDIEEQLTYSSDLFRTPEAAGMTASEWKDHLERKEKSTNKANETLQAKILKQLKRETEYWWKTERKVITDEIKEEIEKASVYRAKAYIKSDETPKLDRRSLRELFDGKIPPKLRGMTEENGAPLDEVAAIFDYESGHEMLEGIINAETPLSIAKEQAQEQMLRKHGDILNDGTLEAEAMDAAHNEERGKLILSELRNLSKRTGALLVNKAALKAQAQTVIGKTRVKDIQPNRFNRAEVRAAIKAQKAFDEGRIHDSIEYKKQQAANFYLFREATNAKLEVEKAQRFVKKFSKKSTLARLGRSGNGYLERINDILSQFDFRKNPRDAKLQEVGEWARERGLDGDSVVVSSAVSKGNSISYKKLSFNDFLGVYDTLKNIDHQSLRATDYYVGEAKLKFERVKEMLLEKLSEVESRVGDEAAARTVEGDKLIYRARAELAKLTDMGSLTLWLDNNDRAGLAHKLIMQPITEAYNKELSLWDEVATPVINAINGRSKETRKRHNTKVKVDGLGSVYIHQLLSVALNLGTESNVDKMARGEGWVDADGKPDYTKIVGIVSRLTKEDWELVQLIWNQMGMLYEPMAEVSKRQTGIKPPKLEHRKVETPFGTFEGGYMPMKYDPFRSEVGAQIAAKDATAVDNLFDNFTARANVDTGARNERTSFSDKINFNLDVVPAHLQETIHYITHYDAIRQIYKLTNDPKIASEIKNIVGIEEHKNIKSWLNAIAVDGKESQAKGFGEPILRRLRFGLTIGIMGYKVTTSLMQLAGLFNSAAEVGVKPMLNSIRFVSSDFSPSGVQAKYEAAAQISNVLPHRMKTMDREMKNAMKSIEGKSGNLAKAQELSMKPIAYIQTYMVDLPTWYAAYDKKLNELQGEVYGNYAETKEKANEQAARYADWVIENVQGSGATKDLSETARSQSEAYKQLTMFMTFFSKLWNRQRTVIREVKAGQMSPMDAASWAMFALVVPNIYDMLIKGELAAPDDGEDDERLQRLLTNVALTSINGVPFVRDVANGVFSDYDYSMSPIASALKYGIAGGKGVVSAAIDDDKEVKLGAVKVTAKLAGAYFGVPGVNQAMLTLDATAKALSGEQDISLRELVVTGADRK